MQVTEIKLSQKQRHIEVSFDNNTRYLLSCEALRLNSPSAEVQGHGGRGGITPTDKEHVNILAIEAVGHYAVKLVFDDGHQSGLYTWDTLYALAQRLGRIINSLG